MLLAGVDGGGTGCRAVLTDGDGRVLGHGEAGPANIASDPEGALANILAAVGAAFAAAGLPPERMAGTQAGLGLAGANAAGAVARIAPRLPFASARIETDAVAAALGALGGDDGVVAAIGTGSVFAARRGSVIRQIGGWGLTLGDEGSGAWIGRAICARALRARDGFLPLTPLLAALLEQHGGPEGLVAFSLRARPADWAALAPRVIGSDDPAAQAVMAQAVADVAAAIDLLRGDEDLPVVFLGGLGPAHAARLAGRFPIRPARGTALEGALILARGTVAP